MAFPGYGGGHFLVHCGAMTVQCMARTLLFWCMYQGLLKRKGMPLLRTAARQGLLTWGCAALCTGAVWARAGQDGDQALPEVQVSAMVKGQALDETQRAFSVTEFGRDEIREQPMQEVESLWNRAPGMHVNHYQLSGVLGLAWRSAMPSAMAQARMPM